MKYGKIYREAADLVEKGWTQGALARDQYGVEVPCDSPTAVCWCLSGALDLASWEVRVNHWMKLTSYFKLYEAISVWNDRPDRTQEEVVKLLKDTAKRADKENKTIGEENEI